MKKNSAGYTLIEVLITSALVAIIARVGFDSYKNYVMRANRALVRTTLQTLAAKQEQQILQNPNTPLYATDFYALIGLGTSSTPPTSYYVDQNGVASTASTGSTTYQISFSSSSTSAYVLQAVAQGVQAKRDTSCTTLLLSNTGLKQAKNSGGTLVSSANVATCWEK